MRSVAKLKAEQVIIPSIFPILLTASAVGTKAWRCPKVFIKLSYILDSRQLSCPSFFRPVYIVPKKIENSKAN